MTGSMCSRVCSYFMSCLLVEVELEGDLVVELVSEPPERDDVLV
jgi:hypothetical protein